MVRTVSVPLILLACVAIALAIPTQAQASSVYSHEIIPAAALAFFRDVLNGMGMQVNYVAFCSGSGTYTLAVGDLSLEEDLFTGAATLYTYSDAGYAVSDDTLELDVSGHLVYSNLGVYPALEERGSVYEFATLLLLCIIAAAMLIRPIFGFCYRNRYGA